MTELVSIIVPVYNVENYLERCLSSIRKQTYINIEVLLINDGSTDNSGEICRKFCKEDHRFQLIEKKNGGLSSARNAGLELSIGSYVTFVDSDDSIAANYTERLYNLITMYQASFASCGIFRTSKEEYQINDIKVECFKSNDILDNLLIDKIPAHACYKLFKKELFDKLRFPIGKNFEDMYIAPVLYANSDKIVITNEKLYYYTDDNFNSISNNTSKANFNKMCIAEAFVDRYYFAKELKRNCLKDVLAIATKQVTDVYRVVGKNNLPNNFLIVYNDFIRKEFWSIMRSYKVDIIKKWFTAMIYFKLI